MPLLDYLLPNSHPDARMTLTERQLLQSVVEIARHVFSAASASVFLIDAETRDLIFEAVAGAGEDHLPGSRFPAGTGIVGWVAGSAQPILVEDLANSDVFARDAAESTGYMPASLMAAPLVHDGDCIGVLEVLDPGVGGRGELGDLNLLALLGAQAAISLNLLVRARSLPFDAPGTAVLRRMADRVRSADPATVELVTRTLTVADELLAATISQARPGA